MIDTEQKLREEIARLCSKGMRDCDYEWEAEHKG